jgi:AraC-like DNA-binding protein
MLDELLDGIRARNAALNRSVLRPPWALRIADGSPLAVLAVIRGHAWVVPADGDPARVGDGEIAVIREPQPYTVADHPATPPDLVCLADNRFATPEGADITAAVHRDLAVMADPPADAAVLVCGTYDAHGAVSRDLLTSLPRLLTVPAVNVGTGIVDTLIAEAARRDPGRQVVLDRLLDVTLLLTLRTWFRNADTHTPAWYRAQQDPVAGPGLRAIHTNPAQPWTVATLAAEAGASRAFFARRFTTLLGEPPLTYLTRWRILRAADLLHTSNATIDSIGRQVGYATAFSFGAAFKRVLGTSPGAYRQSRNT